MSQKKVTILQAQGANRLVINQDIGSSQMLVKICRNRDEWLSPVGWSADEKGTLLDCRTTGDQTELDIPEQFAKSIKPGDKLSVQCPELALSKDITWSEVTETITSSAPVVAIDETGGNLLSRFKRKKIETAPADEISETALRAQEAERVAASYKAKMDAAALAKAEAERKALATAKEAELALKQEMDRIADMERAALAYEEAEHLKQDELRRLDEERRLEEERIAEEARRIEAARQREIAARKAAERKAAIERYQDAITITAEQKYSLENQLTFLKEDAATNDERSAELNASLDKIRETKEKAQRKADRLEAKLSKSIMLLQTTEEDVNAARSASDGAKAENSSLETLYEEAEHDYAEAQHKADQAFAYAQEKQKRLNEIANQKSNILDKLTAASDTLEAKMESYAVQTADTQKVQMSHESLALELSSLQQQMDTHSGNVQISREERQNLDIQIESLSQAIEDLDAQETEHQNILAKLEAGEDLSVTDAPIMTSINVDSVTRTAALKQNAAPSVFESMADNAKAKRTLRFKLRRPKIPKASKPSMSSMPELSMPKVSLPKVDMAELPVKQGAAALAIAALIGAGSLGVYNIADASKTRQVAKTEKTVAPAVASAVVQTSIEQEPSLDDLITEAVKAKSSEVVEGKTTLPEVTSDIPMAPKALAKVEAKPELVAELKMPKASLPVLDVQKPEPKIPTPKVSSPKVSKTKIATSKKNAALVRKPQELRSKYETPAYVEIITNAQVNLFNLGFYNGEIDGNHSAETIEAIKSFKELQGQAVDGEVTGPFLRELRRADEDRMKAVAEVQTVQPSEAIEPAPVQVVEFLAEPYNALIDSQSIAAPTTPAISDTLSPVTSTYSAPAPEIDPIAVQTASAPIISEPVFSTPAVVEIVEAKLIKTPTIEYPRSAVRRGLEVNANINITYDIGTDGVPINVVLKSSDYSGRMSTAFEKAALKAVQDYRFEPRYENGVAMISSGHSKTIKFRMS